MEVTKSALPQLLPVCVSFSEVPSETTPIYMSVKSQDGLAGTHGMMQSYNYTMIGRRLQLKESMYIVVSEGSVLQVISNDGNLTLT